MSNQVVSVIIVTARVKDYLTTCLDSLKKQTYPHLQIIVVDNTKEGLSYSQALNKGIGMSEGGVILCLNDDVILDRNFILEALKGFLADPCVGMVSGKILRPDNKTIDTTGLFLTFWRTAKERGYGSKNRGQFEKSGYVFGVNGAVAFYQKEMLDKINYFDERFGFFYEDLDLAWRAQKAGWRGYYIPSAIAWHVRGGTTRGEGGIDKPFARRFLNDKLHLSLIKNRYLTIKKNESFFDFIVHLPAMVLYEVLVWSHVLLFRPHLIKLFFFENIRRN